MVHPSREEHSQCVLDVLERAGIDLQRRVIEVWNKVDLLSTKGVRHFLQIRRQKDNMPVYLVSALRGDGFDELLLGLDTKLQDLTMRNVSGQKNSKEAIEMMQRSLQRIRIPDGLSAEDTAERWCFLREHCKIVDESITADNTATFLE